MPFHYTSGHLEEAPIYREVAHTCDTLTIYLEVPVDSVPVYQHVLEAIGYWGTSDSLAWCQQVYHAQPQRAECLMPLDAVPHTAPIRHFFACFVTDLHNKDTITWEELTGATSTTHKQCITAYISVWPMIIREQRRTGTILERYPIGDG